MVVVVVAVAAEASVVVIQVLAVVGRDVVVVRAEVVLSAPGPGFPFGSLAFVVMSGVRVLLVFSTRNSKDNVCKLMVYSRDQSQSFHQASDCVIFMLK